MYPISTSPTWPERRTTTRRSPSWGGSTVITAGMGFVERANPPNSRSNIRSAIVKSKSPTRIASALSGQKKVL